MSESASVNSWRENKEVGSLWGMYFTLLVYRFFGRWLVEPILFMVVLYFFLKDSKTRRISLDYLKRLDLSQKSGVRPTFMNVFRHYLSFARTSMDRFETWSDRLHKTKFTYNGLDHLNQLFEKGEGAVLLGAHLGNFDTLRALANVRHAPVHILTDRRNSQKYSGLLKRFFPKMNEGVIEHDPFSIDNIFKLAEAVKGGEYVGLLADRTAAAGHRGASRLSPAMFLGEKAYFSQSPFIFASHLNCSVLLMFGIRRSSREYELIIEPFADRIELPFESREESLSRYISAYAARLEHYCQLNPFQWFNFYDFWRQPS